MDKLSKRQAQVAILSTLGFTNDMIANELGVSLQTVKNHMTIAMYKLECDNRVMVALTVIEEITGERLSSQLMTAYKNL
jgi:DNA-binding NarL/FixJ family response regulator